MKFLIETNLRQWDNGEWLDIPGMCLSHTTDATEFKKNPWYQTLSQLEVGQVLFVVEKEDEQIWTAKFERIS